MAEVQLQDLLAPTWIERARLDDRLFLGLPDEYDELTPWPDDVLKEIGEFKPSPAVFLSALLAFWSEVSLLQHKGKRNKKVTVTPELVARLASPYAAQFPMTPATPQVSESIARGWGAWKVISRLGPYVPLVESQLLACLEHPCSEVQDAAARAFGTMEQISDEVYRQYLAFADRMGRGGLVTYRAAVLAKHTQGARIAQFLQGLEPGAPERLTEARFAVIQLLQGADAQTARRHLQDRLDGAWEGKQLAGLLYTLVRLGQALGFDDEAVPKIRALSTHANGDVRSEAAWFLANQSPQAHHGLLLAMLDDPYHRVLDSIFHGLAVHAQVAPDLLRKAASLGLGNYDGHDGEPHIGAIELVTASAANAQTALPEIAAWWEAASAAEYLERSEIEAALKVADLLGTAAAPLKPGLARALAYLTAPDEAEEELPAVGEPGAVPIIREKLKADMLKAGNPPEVVAAAGQFYGGLLDIFASSEFQKEMEEKDARYEAEMLELYPERYVEKTELEEECEPQAWEEEEDELVVRLRAAIAAA
jgi:hypothetical protein